MPLAIVPYPDDAVPAVRAFNQRLLSGGAPPGLQFPETPHPAWMPGMELFLAMDGAVVHGGYILRRHTFSAATATVAAAHYRLPLSEGVVDRAHALLGLRLVRDALAREPRLYALGMGGWDKPLPQMLQRLGWSMCAVPFHFKVVHPARFLRQIRPLRTTPLRRAALDLAARTGAAWLAMKALGIARRLPPCACRLEDSFGPWADQVWESSLPAYALIGRRDSSTLNQLYPPEDPRFLRVRAAGGWAVLLDTPMHDHKQFGDLRVGTIVDCLAPPADAAEIVRAATHLLEQRGVDLIVSNQLHAAWTAALAQSGFRQGPSNFLLALSPALAAAPSGSPAAGAKGAGPNPVNDPPAPFRHFHFNRGDGDGPIHL